MKREFLQNIKVGDQPLPKEVIDAILDEHSRSIGAIKAEKESLATQLQTAKAAERATAKKEVTAINESNKCLTASHGVAGTTVFI